jgi:transposase
VSSNGSQACPGTASGMANGMDGQVARVEGVLGLDGFVVLAAGQVGGELEVLVETDPDLTGPVACLGCGVLARAHGRREHLVRDLPAAGVATLLVWVKRIWRCMEPACPRKTWSESHPQVAPRAVLTRRARRDACAQVGRDQASVAAVARRLGTGWNTVMSAVREHGVPLVNDPGRLEHVRAVGVDEHVWQHAGPARHTECVTGIVDLTPGAGGRLLDVVKGRTGKVYADWLAARGEGWRKNVQVAALDPFRGYRTALAEHLSHATVVVDAFHVTKLAMTALDEVRRRVQQDTLHHRGRNGDPLYGVRRLLRRGAETLNQAHHERIDAALVAGDPGDQVALARQVAHQVRALFHAPSPEQGRALAARLLQTLPTCPIPEIARLGRTLRAWRHELLAYYDTNGASNGPTEARNLIIEKTRRIAHGYRNFDNYRLRLLLTSGITWNTDLTPRIRPRVHAS